MNAQQGDSRPLDYAPRPAWGRRRAGRLTLIAAVLALVAAVGWRLLPPMFERVRYEYGWHRCTMLSIPPNTVAYEEDWTAAVMLVKSPQYHPQGRVLFDPPWYPSPPAGFVRPACYVPPGYQWIEALPDRHAVIFMHDRTTGHGASRLISVWAASAALSPAGHIVALMGMLHTKRTGTGSVSPPHRSGPGCNLHVDAETRLRLYFGTADPCDVSHFTIIYELTGGVSGRGTIDGWLRDRLEHPDQGYGTEEWIELSVKDGPAAGHVPAETGEQ